jgi:hypothetical protein
MKKRKHALAALGVSALAGIFAASTVPALSGCGEEYCGYRRFPLDLGAGFSNAQVAKAEETKRCPTAEGPIPASDTSGCPTTDAEIEALNRVYCMCGGGTVTNGKCSLQDEPLLSRYVPTGGGDGADGGVQNGYCRYKSHVYLCENTPIN